MTALVMSEKYGHVDAVRSGTKTHTLRIAKPGEVAGFYNGAACVYSARNRVKWHVGCRRAIKAARTGRGLFYVRIVSIREMMLHEMNDHLARKEGIQGSNTGLWGYQTNGVLRCEYDTPVAAFAALWDSIHGDGAFDKNPRVWAIGFEVENGTTRTY